MRNHNLVAVLDGMYAVAPDAEVQMVPHGGLTAILTTAPQPVIRLPQSRRDVLLEAASRLRMQEACLPLATLLPAQANCPLSPDGAVRFLQANQPQLTRLMRQFAGQVQMQISVSWDEAGVLTRFRNTAELAPLFAQSNATPQMLTQAVSRLASRLSLEISQILAPVSTDIAALPLAPSVLWNGAILVPPSQLAALCVAVETVDAIWSEGLHIRQIGPAPIASFVSLELEHISAHKAKGALDRFGPSGIVGRRAGLFAAKDNITLREAVRHDTRIAEAAARLTGLGAGFFLVRIRSEGASASAMPQQEVA